MSMENTPRSNRIHIGIFGKRNSGKSSLINALTGQEIAVVSDFAGTTTDPVYKAMEIHGLGACVFIDTAGLDDEGELGALRIKQTMRAMERTDIALIVCTDDQIDQELQWSKWLKEKNTPILWILNKADLHADSEQIARRIEKQCGQMPLIVSARNREGMEEIRRSMIGQFPDETMERGIVGRLVSAGDVVMLVMPQDIQAPKGRLILPQVQTIRELLDRKCLVMSCTTENITSMIQALVEPP